MTSTRVVLDQYRCLGKLTDLTFVQCPEKVRLEPILPDAASQNVRQAVASSPMNRFPTCRFRGLNIF